MRTTTTTEAMNSREAMGYTLLDQPLEHLHEPEVSGNLVTTTIQAMTAEDAREILPDVLVAVGDKLLRCFITGRFLPMATVTPNQWYEPTLAALRWAFSWEAVARSCNTGIPLTV